MWSYTVKSLWAHRTRMGLTIAAIALAVAFVSGVAIFTGRLGDQYATLAYGRIGDVMVAPRHAYNASATDVPDITFTARDVAAIADMDGVASANGIRRAGPVTYVPAGLDDEAAEAERVGSALTPITLAGWGDLTTAAGEPALVLREGHAPSTASDVVIAPELADRYGTAIGDRLSMTVASDALDRGLATTTMTVVGVGGWASPSQESVPSSEVFTTPAGVARLAGTDAYDRIWVTTEAGTPAGAPAGTARDVDDLLTTIARVLPARAEALPAPAIADLAEANAALGLGFLQPLLYVFAGLSVVTAAILIVNTLSIIVVQRQRELALVRALGATGHQVRTSVLAEAALLGAVGSALGIATGWLAAWGLLRLVSGHRVPLGEVAISPAVVVGCLVLGIGVTMWAGLSPAVRASRIAPVQAMTGTSGKGRRRRLRRPGTRVAGARALRRFPVGRLAMTNARRRPGRSFATASTLAIAMAMVALMGVVAASMQASITGMLAEEVTADVLVGSSSALSPSQQQRITETAGVERVREQVQYGVGVNGTDTSVMSATPEGWGHPIPMDIREGRIPTARDELALSATTAEQADLAVGDRVRGTVGGHDVTWRVVGLWDYPGALQAAGYATAPATFTDRDARVDTVGYSVTVAEGTEAVAVRKELAGRFAGDPRVQVLDIADLDSAMGSQIDQLLYGMYGLLAMSVLIAALGIANTLNLSVAERGAEIRLLHSVGLDRRQVQSMVTLEAVVLALGGAAGGLALGAWAGAGIQSAMAGQGFEVLLIPWGAFALALVVATLIGVVAAWLPGRRALATAA